MSDVPQVMPRTLRRDVPIIRSGAAVAVIVRPADQMYEDLADQFAAAVERFTGARLAQVTDRQLLPRRDSRLSDDYLSRPLILLGNLNTNRVLMPLYARHFCATDATYPGPGGYEVRTLVNPYGTRVNSLLLGGSDAAGVQRAVERCLTQIERSARPGEFTLPFTLDISLAPELAARLSARTDTRLDAPLPAGGALLLNAIGAYAIQYAWTGDVRYGLYARDCLLRMNEQHAGGYGDWHYNIERIARAVPWLSAGGLLDDTPEGNHSAVLRTDELLLGTATGTQHMWWRMKDGRPPLGHRHHGKGTFAFYQVVRYLLDHAVLNEAARQLCERWAAECREFLDALARARVDDQDDESTLNNQSTLVWYALGEERFDLFESGNALLMAQRAIGVHDNLGAGAGVEGYGEGLLGAMYMPQEAGILVGACAFYYQDGQLSWIRQHMPNLQTPLRWDGWSLSPPFMHKFDTGAELVAQPPERFLGLHVLPISPYQAELVHHSPLRLHNEGHFVEAPEVWQAQGGVGTTTLPAERMFDKLVARGAFEHDAPYLLLQGYHGGYRWQGSMHSVNAFVRFSQFGHIFLIQNTDRQSYLHKNGLLASDGYNNTPLSPVGEWLVAGDYPRVALGATRVEEFHHCRWTRCLFWLKAGHGTFLTIDSVETKQTGPYSFTLTWRTPLFASLQGWQWLTRQGAHIFRLCWDQDLNATSEPEGVQGAASPHTLRQVQSGDFAAGHTLTFHNLFYARPCEAYAKDTPPLSISRLSPGEALILEAGSPVAWCALQPQQLGDVGAVRAVTVLVTPEVITLGGAQQLELRTSSLWHLDSSQPIGVYLDLVAQRGTVQADTPESTAARVKINLGERAVELVLDADPFTFDLPAGACVELQAAVARQLAAWTTPLKENHATRPIAQSPDSPPADWRYSGWQATPERIRDMTVSADPLPLDGYADQLVDVVTPEIRTLTHQWPDAPHYDFCLNLGAEQDLQSLRIIGDSFEKPTLRVFHPLPEPIEVSVSSDGFHSDIRPCSQPHQREEYIHRHFYAAADMMEALRIPIQQRARQVRVRVPHPAGGTPLVLHELELYASALVPPKVRRLLTADLDGDGQAKILAISDTHEVAVLDHHGGECWRWSSRFPITHLACHDLDGNGRQQVVIATLNREVRLFEPDGRLRQLISLPAFQAQGKADDLHMGAMQAVNSTAVWHREPDGRGALALGCYGLIVFLDPAGEMLGHSFVDGSWVTDLQALPALRLRSKSGAQGAPRQAQSNYPEPVEGWQPQGGMQEAWDLWARSRWNHGINIFHGLPGLVHSGDAISFGGVRQPLFRPCERVLPFVTGDSVPDGISFGLVSHGGEQYVLAANENGFGVLSGVRRDWVWKVEGGTPATSCHLSEYAGEPVVLIGGADGFVSAFGLLDGRPRQRKLFGTPVVGLAIWPRETRWVAVTRERLSVLNPLWQETAAYGISASRANSPGPGEIVVAQPNGQLVHLAL